MDRGLLRARARPVDPDVVGPEVLPAVAQHQPARPALPDLVVVQLAVGVARVAEPVAVGVVVGVRDLAPQPAVERLPSSSSASVTPQVSTPSGRSFGETPSSSGSGTSGSARVSSSSSCSKTVSSSASGSSPAKLSGSVTGSPGSVEVALPVGRHPVGGPGGRLRGRVVARLGQVGALARGAQRSS